MSDRTTCRVTYADGTPCTKPPKSVASGLCKACQEWRRRNGGADPDGRPLSAKRPGSGRKTCSVVEDGQRCTGPAAGDGMCLKHYKRARRNGSPLVVVRPKRANGDALAAVQAAATATTDECIILTTPSGDRPQVTLDGVHMLASRGVWILANGDPGEALVLHSCNDGSGESGCINIRHLRLGDSAENMRDKVEAVRQVWGEAHHKHKLTEDQVRQVRERYKPRHPVDGVRAMAREFGVDPTTISLAVRGKTWRPLTDK